MIEICVRATFAPNAGITASVARHIRTKYAPRPAAGDYALFIEIASGREDAGKGELF